MLVIIDASFGCKEFWDGKCHVLNMDVYICSCAPSIDWQQSVTVYFVIT